MSLRYLELDDIHHLHEQAHGGGVYDDRLWRESYYFNMTDSESGISLISTIGLLPNRKLLTGFVLIIDHGKIVLLKPLVKCKKPIFNDYCFAVRDLEYSLVGIKWRIKYDIGKYKFNILFQPINKIYQYITSASDRVFNRIGTQHYEQFGMFEGDMELSGRKIKIGPCFGHRDHSWGIRDWSSVARYRLFCCAFSKKFAFNLWEGLINGRRFLKGFVFDGEQNLEIIKSSVISSYRNSNGEPDGALVSIVDDSGQQWKIKCETQITLPIPPSRSILYETIAKMRTGDKVGYGLLEYLYHEPNPLVRAWMFLRLVNMS